MSWWKGFSSLWSCLVHPKPVARGKISLLTHVPFHNDKCINESEFNQLLNRAPPDTRKNGSIWCHVARQSIASTPAMCHIFFLFYCQWSWNWQLQLCTVNSYNPSNIITVRDPAQNWKHRYDAFVQSPEEAVVGISERHICIPHGYSRATSAMLLSMWWLGCYHSVLGRTKLVQ